MQKDTQTGHTLLKAHVVRGVAPLETSVDHQLRALVGDKGYSRQAIVELSNDSIFGDLIRGFLLRGVPYADLPVVANYFGKRIKQPSEKSRAVRAYRGDPQDALAADRMLTMISTKDRFVGQGATGAMHLPRLSSLPHSYLSVPIAIIGSGPAGIMLNRALRQYGFDRVTMFEKRQKFGIWSQQNVFGGSRNNPRDVNFADIATLRAAPGTGHEVQAFLSELITSRTDPVKRQVSGITPSDLKHQVHIKSGDQITTETYPIVINATGIGKPVPVSDPRRMVGPEEHVTLKRWQTPDLDRERVRGKRFVFIGLGNSTAEMIRLIHRYQDAGVDVDYRIVTHYPRDSVFSPSDVVNVGETDYRVFRDVSKPQLVSYQGDLPESRADYFRALLGGRIISGVKKWDVDGRRFAAYDGKGNLLEDVEYGDLYHLSGYKHSPEDLEAMGCTYDKKFECALHDYDGEITRKKNAIGGDRVHRGYFGFGAVLDAPHNPNTVVIPGMAFRLPDLLFGIIMRAGECAHQKHT